MPRIAVTADLHFDRQGYLTSPEVVDGLAARIHAAKPDAVIIAGDVGHPSDNFASCLAAFRHFMVPVAVLAGNHDVWRDNEGGWSSRELWNRRLASLVEAAGFVWLESTVLRLGDAAVVGSLAWYDYSAAPPTLARPPEYFAGMKRHLSNDATWIDWPWSDVELASALHDGLVQRLEAVEADAGIREVLLVTHVPLFEEQMLRKPGDLRWEISNAYYGNFTIGLAVRRFKKVVRVISGHTHCAQRGVVHRAGGPDLPVSVIGSDYGSPEVEVIEL